MSHTSLERWIKAAGGAVAIAKASQETDYPIMSVKTVYKWPVNGVPQWHWPMLMKLSGATEKDLRAADQEARDAKRRRGKHNKGDTRVAA